MIFIYSLRRLINRFDPIFILLNKVVFKPLFYPPLPGKPGEVEVIELAQREFLEQNLNKHRAILWINISIAIF